MIPVRLLLITGIAVLPLAAQAQADKSGALDAKYACADGTTLTARFTKKPERVSLKHGDKSWRLPIARSGSGARYSNGRVTFWEHQGEATVEGKGL